MFIKILKVKEDDHWAISDCPHNEKIKNVWGVYVFDPDWRVHLCEMTASFELHALETQVEFQEGTNDEEREATEDWIRQYDHGTSPVIYMHCHMVNDAGRFKEGWFPKGNMGTYRMPGFGTGFNYNPQDIEASRKEQLHNYIIDEAEEYCHQNAV